MTDSRLQELLQKWLARETDETEQAELMHFFSLNGSARQREWFAEAVYHQTNTEKEISPEDSERIIAEILGQGAKLVVPEQGIGEEERYRAARSLTADIQSAENYSGATTPGAHPVHFLRKWGWAAAVLIFLLGIGTYQTLKIKSKNLKTEQAGSNNITPGKEGAILTLADGSQVVLDSLGNGVIALQNGSQAVIKNGELEYAMTGETSTDIVFNTMTTPKGRQFSLLLPDGTKVWLNAASSIRYPTVFTGKERQVEISGEAYLEVAKNVKAPFIVKSGNTDVLVLGTSFNINAYPDEDFQRITLLNGSVKVSAGGSRYEKDQKKMSISTPSVILKPGEAADIVEDIKVANANIGQDLAWKNGYFSFENVRLQQMAKQLERWYDVDIEFVGNITDIELKGRMDRGVNLDDIMHFFEEYGFKTHLNGRTITIERKQK